jgi:hypothetical protein
MTAFLNEYTSILDNTHEFRQIPIKEKMTDQIYCECSHYHTHILDVLHLLQSEECENGGVKLFYKSDDGVKTFFEINVYFKNDKIHRDNDLPAIEFGYLTYGTMVTWNVYKIWFYHGKIFRRSGPSVIFSIYNICLYDELNLLENEPEAFNISKKDKKYMCILTWKDGDKIHRMNAPAIIKMYGYATEYDYYLNGKEYSKEEHNKLSLCFKWARNLKKKVLSRCIYTSNKYRMYNDVSQLVSSYVY